VLTQFVALSSTPLYVRIVCPAELSMSVAFTRLKFCVAPCNSVSFLCVPTTEEYIFEAIEMVIVVGEFLIAYVDL